MHKFLILLLFVVFAKCMYIPFFDSTCNFTRTDALKCMLKYGDKNHHGGMTKDEIQEAMNELLPWGTSHLFVSVNRIMQDCDFDKNGILTPRDWELSFKTCMPKKRHLCTFAWFCKRASNN